MHLLQHAALLHTPMSGPDSTRRLPPKVDFALPCHRAVNLTDKTEKSSTVGGFVDTMCVLLWDVYCVKAMSFESAPPSLNTPMNFNDNNYNDKITTQNYNYTKFIRN